MHPARTFKELSDRTANAKEAELVERAKIIHRNESRGSMVIISLFWIALFGFIILFQQIEMHGLNNANRRQTVQIETLSNGKDSIIFNCYRCGLEHKLEQK